MIIAITFLFANFVESEHDVSHSNKSSFVAAETALKEYLDNKVPKYAEYPGAEAYAYPVIKQIISVNEREGIWTTKFEMNARYHHPDFAWNYSLYEGITFMRFTQGDFWTPTFSMPKSDRESFINT